MIVAQGSRHMAKRSLVEKSQSGRQSGTCLILPKAVLTSENFSIPSSKATKSLMCLCSQLSDIAAGPKNNGDLFFTHSIAETWQGKSKKNVSWASKKILECGWTVRTRQRGLAGLQNMIFLPGGWRWKACGRAVWRQDFRLPPVRRVGLSGSA